MGTAAIILAIVGLLALVGVVLYLFWPRVSELGELARIRAEEQLALWQLQTLSRDAAERMRRERDRKP